MAKELTKQLTKHIDEGIAMEQGVLRMLDSMLRTTRDTEIERALDKHKETTNKHVQRLQERLAAHGARRSLRRRTGALVISRAKGAIDVARREKPGRNARDGFATEQMEVAAYELLERIARQAGDHETAEVARQNRAEDEAMAGLIARNWDKFAEEAISGDAESGGEADGGGLKDRAKQAAGLVRNPIALGVGSVVGGLLLGGRLQAKGEGGQPPKEDEQALATLPKAELQTRAKQAGVTVTRSMTKQELVDALTMSGRRGQRAGGKANPVEVQKFLQGVGYPASRDDLLKEAERRGAHERVRASLSALPRKRFQSPTEVSEALGRQ